MAAFANLSAQNARVDFSLREENCLAVLINLQMQNVRKKKNKKNTTPKNTSSYISSKPLLSSTLLLLFIKPNN